MAKPQESPVYDQKPEVMRQLRSELQRGKSVKGGIALARVSTREFILQRGRKGGTNTRDMYGEEFYSWISSQRRIKLGWPKGKMRKNQPAIAAAKMIEATDIKPEVKSILQGMIRVTP